MLPKNIGPEILAERNGTFTEKHINLLNAILLSLTAISLIVKLYLIFTLKINWDEFFFLSKVHLHLNSTQERALFQNFHVLFFSWIPMISSNEVNQVISARMVLFCLLVGSSVFIYRIGILFLNKSGVLFSLLCYLCLSNMMIHAASFRADPICSFLFIASVYLMLSHKARPFAMAGCGSLMALSLMISIKASFHLFTLGLIFLCFIIQFQDKKRTLVYLGYFSAVFFIFLGLIFFFHQFGKVTAVGSNPFVFAAQAAKKVIFQAGFFPARGFFAISLYENATVWVLTFIGIGIWIKEVFIFKDGLPYCIPFAFLFPLLTLFFYRNAFPYYYVFIMAPAIIFAGKVIHMAMEDFRKSSSTLHIFFAGLFIFLVFFQFVINFSKIPHNEAADQRIFFDQIHQIFPRPV